MPTSAEEARNIVAIMNEYLPFDKATEITKRLDKEIGSKTDNDSLKVSLKMLRELYERMPPPKIEPQEVWPQATFFNNNAPLYLKLMLYSVVGFHMLVLAGNVVAMFLLPFYMPWIVALPIISLLINFMFSAISCPLTRLESVIRRKMGLPEIRYFIQHYFFKPSWRKSRSNC